MSNNYGPRIVTDGLVLCLDAADKKSYPGSGTTWYDRSGNGNNGILTNGPTFDSGNGGSIVFDGADDYATIPSPQLVGKSVITIEMFTNWRSKNGGMFLGFTLYDVFTYGGHLGYNNGNGNLIGISSTTVTNLSLKGNFHNYVFIMKDGGYNLSDNKIYIDGEDMGALTPQLSSDGPCRNFTNSFRLCSWNNGGFNGDNVISNVKVYDRELSTSEIQQNYNATKNRFGY